MYKSYHKKIISTAVITSAVLFATACNASNEESKTAVAKPAAKIAAATTSAGFSERVTSAVGPAKAAVSDTVKKTYEHNGKLAVDGGVIYPIVNGKTGAYHANEEAHKTPFNKGKTATANEIKAWDIDVMPDGTGLPEGSGSVEFGDEVYEEKCLSCHGDFGAGAGFYPKLTAGNAYEAQKTLINQRVGDQEEGPQRTFGSNWPYASTLWWYIKTGMPHQAPMSLTTEEVYALSAYILYINEMEIDGVLVDDEYVLDREKFLKIVMPNVDGFEPKINGPQGQDNARAYYNEPLNYGNGVRCMKDCFEGEPELQRIAQALSDFSPALSSEKNLPAPSADAKAEHPGKAGYDKACAMCHDSGAAGAPITGNAGEWAKALEKGKDAVYANGLNGVGAMPPKGGAMSLTEEQFNQMVDYMLEASK